MILKTAGELPSRDVFDALFNQACWQFDYIYKVRNCRMVGDVDYTRDTLWEQILSFMTKYETDEDDQAFDWVCSVLFTLGIEWV